MGWARVSSSKRPKQKGKGVDREGSPLLEKEEGAETRSECLLEKKETILGKGSPDQAAAVGKEKSYKVALLVLSLKTLYCEGEKKNRQGPHTYKETQSGSKSIRSVERKGLREKGRRSGLEVHQKESRFYRARLHPLLLRKKGRKLRVGGGRMPVPHVKGGRSRPPGPRSREAENYLRGGKEGRRCYPRSKRKGLVKAISLLLKKERATLREKGGEHRLPVEGKDLLVLSEKRAYSHSSPPSAERRTKAAVRGRVAHWIVRRI